MIRSIFFICFVLIASSSIFAQTEFMVSPDPKDPKVLVFKGVLSRQVLEKEPSFTWYNSGVESYKPHAKLLAALENPDSTLHFLVFGGTWCDDTQFILPRFLKALQTAHFPDSAITILGVDRNKKTIGDVSGAFQITHVPTIIVMKNGIEAGRVVEYGKTGVWDAEVAGFIQ